MRLFDIDENYQVKPNKAWIVLIPELEALYKRDKGSAGDSDGRKKLQFRRELSFIYFYLDFASPIRDHDPDEKLQEAMDYSGLKEEMMDDIFRAAMDKYIELQLKASRSLRTLRALHKGLDAMDKYFEEIDFSEVDKKGELKHSADKFAGSIIRMNKVYDEIKAFENRVEQDLTASDTGIRGQSTLGDNEATRKNNNSTWSEADIRAKSEERSAKTTKSKKYGEITKDLEKVRSEFDDAELEE